MKLLLILSSAIFTYVSLYAQTPVSKITFKDLTVEIHSLAPFDEQELNTVFASEAAFTADLGETLEAQTIIVKSDKYKDVEIYQAVETSVSISWEGPHCDLTQWKHYTSAWRKLNEVKPFVFKAIAYEAGEARKFPSVTLAEVKKAVAQHCGESWAEHIQTIKSIYDYPCGVDISMYLLKIKAIDKTTGERMEKLIKISIPMGC
jgi:hypothetical protein